MARCSKVVSCCGKMSMFCLVHNQALPDCVIKIKCWRQEVLCLIGERKLKSLFYFICDYLESNINSADACLQHTKTHCDTDCEEMQMSSFRSLHGIKGPTI